MSGSVRVLVEDGIATVTLDAPERLNAVDGPMLETLAQHVEELDGRSDVRVVALTGAGRGFCSGAALGVPSGDLGNRTLVAAGRAVRTVASSATPVVALVNGVAAGVGVSLALASSYALATRSASFMLAFTRIGLMPDGGATALVTAAVGRARALRLALTAERLPAPIAEEWGLIAECCADEEFGARSAALLRGLRDGAPLAMARTLAAVNAAAVDLDAALRREEEGQLELLATEDAREGIAAFFERRPAQFRGR